MKDFPAVAIMNRSFALLLVKINDFWVYSALLCVPLLLTPFTAKPYTDAKEFFLQVTALTSGALTVTLLLSGYLSVLKQRLNLIFFYASFLIYFLVNVASSLVAINFSESYNLLKNLLAYFFITVWITVRATDEDFSRRLLSIITFTVSVVAIYGLIQYIGYDFLSLEVKHSPVSTLGNVNFVAQFYLASLPFVVIAVFITRNVRTRYVFFGVTILALIHLLLTYSRGGYVGIFCGILLGLSLYSRTRWSTISNFLQDLNHWLKTTNFWITIAGITLVTSTFLYLDQGRLIGQIASIFHEQQESNRYRLLTWKSTLNMVADYPVLGVGVGNFRFIISHYKTPALWELQDPTGRMRQLRTHNDYLNILAESGVLGFLSFVILIGFVLFKGLKMDLNLQNTHQNMNLWFWLHLGGLMAMVATLTQSMFDFNLYNVHSALYFWMAVAITIATTFFPESLLQRIKAFKTNLNLVLLILLCIMLSGIFVVNYDGAKRFISAAHLRSGEVAALKKSPKQALASFKQAQKIYPQNIDAIAAEADLLRKLNDFEAAAKAYKKWLTVEPFLLTIYNSLGYCYVKMGEYQLAGELYKEGLRLNPQNPVLLNNMANLMLVMKNYPEAVKYYRLAAEVPNQFSKENRLNFARALLATRNFSEAVLILRALYQEQPEDFLVLKLLADTELKLGNFPSARELLLRLLLLSPPDQRQNYYKLWQQAIYERESRNDEKNAKE